MICGPFSWKRKTVTFKCKSLQKKQKKINILENISIDALKVKEPKSHNSVKFTIQILISWGL